MLPFWPARSVDLTAYGSALALDAFSARFPTIRSTSQRQSLSETRSHNWAVAQSTPSRPRELHPQPLTDPCLKLSLHTARCHSMKAAAFQYYQAHPGARWPGFLSGDPPPSLRGHYTASSLIRGSPPLTNASILSASCCCTCTFSLVIIGQVLKFRIGAWLRFTPPVRRSPPAR